jgi:exo-1,4-beta-D-glucosaminidase
MNSFHPLTRTDEKPFYSKNLQNMPREPFDTPWWYRTNFTLPASEQGKQVTITFKGINYKANIFVNGVQIADSDSVQGAFR